MFDDRRPDFQKRKSDSAAGRKVLLEGASKVSEDPRLAERKEKRVELVRAREFRTAQRETARKARETKLAA